MIDTNTLQAYMRLLITVVLLSFVSLGYAQVFVQLELYNDPSTKKYAVGDKITFRMNYDQKTWSKGVIKEILIEENTLILNNNIIELKDVSDFMLFRPTINAFSGLLQAFGAVYIIQGGIGSLSGRGNVNLRNVLLTGGGTYIGGWIIRKLFYKIPISLGEKNRLRIVDLRFSVD